MILHFIEAIETQMLLIERGVENKKGIICVELSQDNTFYKHDYLLRILLIDSTKIQVFPAQSHLHLHLACCRNVQPLNRLQTELALGSLT